MYYEEKIYKVLNEAIDTVPDISQSDKKKIEKMFSPITKSKVVDIDYKRNPGGMAVVVKIGSGFFTGRGEKKGGSIHNLMIARQTSGNKYYVRLDSVSPDKNIALKRKIRIYSFSTKKKKANIKLNSIKKEGKKYKVFINVGNQKMYFYTSSNFENDIKNLLAALTVIGIFKSVSKLNKNIFYNHKKLEGRGDISKIKINKKNIYLIDESYNSNPLSLKSAIKNFDALKVNDSKKHLVLGDMLELGRHSKKLHSEISSIINKTSIDYINVIGKNIAETYKNINKNKKGLILKKNSQIIHLIKNYINNNDYLMIKGSNSTGLHKVTNSLKTGRINVL